MTPGVSERSNPSDGSDRERGGRGVGVRPARPEDVEGLADLLGQLFAIEADFAVDAAKQRAGLGLFLGRTDAFLAVAEAAGVAVGMCSVQTLVSTAAGGPVGLLEDLVVRQDWRGRGVGTRLLAAAEAWSRGRGLLRLQLLADRENAPALEFYRERGWAGTRLGCLRRAFWPDSGVRGAEPWPGGRGSG